MNQEIAHKLVQELDDKAVVVDIGGGAAAFPRADYVFDAVSIEQAGSGSDGNVNQRLNVKPRYSASTWVQLDLCKHEPWPFPDKYFDFAVCSHLLEDVRDPIWICSEIRRVAKAGYIETPSRLLEQSLGVENPCYTGFHHHRWLITAEGNRLTFRHKPALLAGAREMHVCSLSAVEKVNPEVSVMSFFWQGTFEFEEALLFDHEEIVDELIGFARQHQSRSGLKMRNENLSFMDGLRRRIYYWRLKRGMRP
jgi:hypothetical protein